MSRKLYTKLTMDQENVEAARIIAGDARYQGAMREWANRVIARCGAISRVEDGSRVGDSPQPSTDSASVTACGKANAL